MKRQPSGVAVNDWISMMAIRTQLSALVVLATTTSCWGLPSLPTRPLPVEYVPDVVGNKVCNALEDTNTLGLSSYELCCESPPIDSADECVDLVSAHLLASVDAARDAGLSYSADCPRAMHRGLGCPDPNSGTFLACEDDCQIFFGEQPEGAQCESFGHRMSDCEQGLVCGADRVCHQPCEVPFVAPENGFCGPTRGMWFVTCDSGLSCADDGTCQPAQSLGSPCDAATACAVGGWCDTGTCTAVLVGGSPCIDDDQCASNLCKDGACYEPESAACGRWAW